MVNLLADSPENRRRTRHALLLQGLLMLCVLLLFEGAWRYTALSRHEILQKDVQTLRARRASTQGDGPDFTRCRQQFAAIQALPALHAARNHWWNMLQKTVRAMPAGLAMTRLAQTGTALQIQGQVLAPAAVSAFVTRLSGIPGFKQVRPQTIQQTEGAPVQFSVTGHVAGALPGE